VIPLAEDKNVSVLLVKRRIGRTEASNESVTVKAIKEKSVNVSWNAERHKTERVKKWNLVYI